MKIILNSPGFSINSLYYGNRKLGKTAEAREWSAQINWQLAKYAKEFMELRQSFDASKHGFKVTLIFTYMNFYNKEGKISSKVHDLSNVEKPLIDLLFLKANHGQAPYKAPNLAVDDKYICDLISSKRPGLQDSIEVCIELQDL
jgi:hypothetical protein